MSNVKQKKWDGPGTGYFERRYNVFMVRFYEDDYYLGNILNCLDKIGWPYAGIRHAADKERVHHHIILVLNEARRLCDIFDALGFPHIGVVPGYSEAGAYRLLCCEGGNDTERYDPDLIYGPLSFKARAAFSK